MEVEICGDEGLLDSCQVSDPQWNPIGESVLTDLIRKKSENYGQKC